MPRPRKFRKICFDPEVVYFKPAGVRLVDLKEVVLNKEEVEVIRLVDYDSIDQKKAAEQMQISQPTLSRLLESARKKVGDFLINGKALRIESEQSSNCENNANSKKAGFFRRKLNRI